eukprot:361616-Chlamydomonas_euryale.AAC.10
MHVDEARSGARTYGARVLHALIKTLARHGARERACAQVGALQRRLATALLNQGMACRAMSFILFGKVSTMQPCMHLQH